MDVRTPAREMHAEAGETIIVPVEGMTCASCVGRIERAIGKVPAVSNVAVNLATERAEISFGNGQADRAAVVSAIMEAGYPSALQTTELSIRGMTCASCVGRVERALKAVPGVLKAQVHLATETAYVEAIEKAGYSASIQIAASSASQATNKKPVGPMPDDRPDCPILKDLANDQ